LCCYRFLQVFAGELYEKIKDIEKNRQKNRKWHPVKLIDILFFGEVIKSKGRCPILKSGRGICSYAPL
jgi:7,8-dihydro-6-hydroxymethylpterin-pyrophosphokinase